MQASGNKDAVAHGSDWIFGGEVVSGFEPVQELFIRHFEEGFEDCAQVCVYHRGVKVVDLWGAPRDDKTGLPRHSYGPDGLQNVFSSTKTLTSLVVAILVDRGLLRYDQKVAEIWPEYAQNGKQDTTLAHVMRHEAGLSEFKDTLQVSDLTSERIKEGAVSEIIAGQKALHKPGEKRQYHAMTRGLIVNEIVRRVDPQGRTVGEVLRDDVAEPLGLMSELVVGLPAALDHRVAPVWREKYEKQFGEALLPACMGGGRHPGIQKLGERGATATIAMLMPVARHLMKPSITVEDLGDTKAGRRILRDVALLFNETAVRRAELPSANGHCSARALAKVAACIAEGSVEGKRLLSKEGIAQALADPVEKKMLGKQQKFTNAGWCLFGEPNRPGWAGWMGLGGSVMQWHEEQRVAFGYATTLLDANPMNGRALELQHVAVACARAM